MQGDALFRSCQVSDRAAIGACDPNGLSVMGGGFSGDERVTLRQVAWRGCGLIWAHRIHCITVYVDTAITRMLGLMNGKDSFENDKVPPQTRMLGPAVKDGMSYGDPWTGMLYSAMRTVWWVHLPHPAEGSHVTRPSQSVHRVRAILNKTSDLLDTPVHYHALRLGRHLWEIHIKP